MSDHLLLSTAYFPPIEYFSLIAGAESVQIETQENYVKQTYRNRCYILSSNGPQILSVPVLMGSFHKTAIKEIKIDYSKRWQQVHKRAIISAYNNSPYFPYFFGEVERVIDSDFVYLLDLNAATLEIMAKFIGIKGNMGFTESFFPLGENNFDYRYKISPKIPSTYRYKNYIQVFPTQEQVQGLSILDLLFNNGPDSLKLIV